MISHFSSRKRDLKRPMFPQVCAAAQQSPHAPFCQDAVRQIEAQLPAVKA